jgi:hypothetical protein
MDERDQTTDGALPPNDEEIVRGLLEEAGPRPPIPQDDLDAISTAARSAWRTQVRRRPPAHRAVWISLAAALTVAIGIVWWWTSRGGRVPTPAARVEAVVGSVRLEKDSRPIAKGETIPLGAVLRSGAGRASLRLTGGATARLDVESQLSFVSASTLDLESGALYVDTGSGRPSIEVRTPMGTASDVGTRFAVRIVGTTALLVRVRDGAVLTQQRGRTYLTPAGQELLLRHDGTLERRDVAAHGPEWEWVLEASPGFDIEGRSLQEFLDWVSRETGWQIRYADNGLAESAAKIELHGSIGKLRADRAPFAVLPGAGLEGRLEDGTLVVQRHR